MFRVQTYSRFLPIIAFMTVLGFAPAYADNTQLFGTVVGAGLGGLIGNQFGHGGGRVAATAGGAVLGGYIGNEIGRSSDRGMRYRGGYRQRYAYYAQPVYIAPPVYYSSYYEPNYVAPPAPPPPIYVDHRSGNYCREYSQLVRIGNEVRESYGTACLQPDGSWRIIN